MKRTEELRKYGYVDCRLNHLWETFYPDNMRRPLFGLRISFVCTRCGTERHQLVSRRTGELLAGNYYRYPHDYKPTHEFEKNDFRAEFARRHYPVKKTPKKSTKKQKT